METKKILRWIVTNLAVVGMFLAGTIYGIEWLLLISLVLLWFTAIGGTFVWLFVNLLKNQQGKSFDILVFPKDSLPNEEERDKLKEDKIFCITDYSLMKITVGSVSRKLDAVFDTIVVGILVYFGYTWLPLFYITHMLGLWDIRSYTEKLLFEFFELVASLDDEEQPAYADIDTDEDRRNL